MKSAKARLPQSTSTVCVLLGSTLAACTVNVNNPSNGSGGTATAVNLGGGVPYATGGVNTAGRSGDGLAGTAGGGDVLVGGQGGVAALGGGNANGGLAGSVISAGKNPGGQSNLGTGGAQAAGNAAIAAGQAGSLSSASGGPGGLVIAGLAGQSGTAGSSSGAPLLTVPGGAPTLIEDFDGTLAAAWVPMQAVGGDFAHFAQITNSTLVVNVPAGNSWGKTGVRSKDPIFTVTEDMATSPISLVVDFDPDATSGYVIALSPEINDDIWSSTNVWASFIRHPTAGGTSVSLVNTQNSSDVSQSLTNAPLTAPATVAVVARPSHAQVCASSGWGLEGRFAWLTPGAQVYAYAFTHPYDQGMPSKMAIKSIRVLRGAACGAQDGIPAFTAPPESPVWSDAFHSGTATNWAPLQAVGGDFASFAKTTTDELWVDVPQGNSWGKTGIRSNYFLFDVRDDFATAPLAATFTFDPTRTSGYVIALSQSTADDIWTASNVWMSFLRHPTAAGASASLSNSQNTQDSARSLPNIPSEAPTTVTLAVRPGHVQACTSTGWGMEGDFSWITTGAKVYGFVFSHPYDQGMSSRFALESVGVTRSAACGATGSIAPYPAPLPRTLFLDDFAGGYAVNWVPEQAAGGDFASFAKVTTGEVYVDVPANNSWGKTGVRSNYFLFDVRSDYGTSPLDLEFTFDPARTTGYRVVLSTSNADDIWTASNVWTGYIYDPVNNRGVFDLVNTQNTSDTSTSLSTLPATAPDKLTLTISPRHVKASMTGGYVLEGDYSWLDVGAKVYAHIFTHPYQQNAASRMALESVRAIR